MSVDNPSVFRVLSSRLQSTFQLCRYLPKYATISRKPRRLPVKFTCRQSGMFIVRNSFPGCFRRSTKYIQPLFVRSLIWPASKSCWSIIAMNHWNYCLMVIPENSDFQEMVIWARPIVFNVATSPITIIVHVVFQCVYLPTFSAVEFSTQLINFSRQVIANSRLCISFQ
jgi:hypothetical protein